MTGAAAVWTGTGQCVVCLAFGAPHSSGLPEGMVPVPGPHLVVAARYDSSPVGPYLELAVAEPVRAGRRAGLCVTTMVVDSQASLEAGRETWGFPKELGTLRWSAGDDVAALRWEERGVEVRGHAGGPRLPAPVPFGAIQGRGSELVRVWGLLRGRARPARVDVEVPDRDPLAGLAGRHRGATVTAGTLRMGRPRRLRSP